MIRRARVADVDDLVGLVRELAAYEREPDKVELTGDALRQALFGSEPQAFAHVAEVDGHVVGMAIWFRTFSTWTGRHGIWLEDLYVRPEVRRRGLGRALLESLAALALDEGAARLEWAVLDWNEPARDFYRAVGALAMDEWTVHRLHGAALEAAGRRRPTDGDPLSD